MKFISTKSFTIALIIAILSLGTVSTSLAGNDVAAAIAEAKKATGAAKKAGFEWRYWEAMYKKAEAAIKDGKADKAIKIAKQLTFQGLAAQKQA
jgi:Sec-independent protein translocase protein TatA